MITQNINIHPYDKNRWVVNAPGGKHLLVNEATLELIRILSDSQSKESARELFNERFRYTMSQVEFNTFVDQKLSSLGISGDAAQPSSQPGQSYLLLKVEVLQPRFVALCCRPFKFLFADRIFWAAFPLLFVILSIVFFLVDFSSLVFRTGDYYLLAPIVLLSILFHEIGHAAACSKFGVRHGGIGFGFYFIFPVFYTDITNIWTATKSKRLIANLAGVYHQFIYASLLLSAYTIAQQQVYLVASFLVFLKSLTELNPFVRLDGYWILSDLTNTPNLLGKSKIAASHAARSLYSRIIGKKNNQLKTLNRKVILLSLYGISNSIFMVAYCSWMMVSYHRRLLNFPGEVFELISAMASRDFESINIDYRFMLMLAFYILIVKILILFVRKNIPVRSKRVNLAGRIKTPSI